MIEPAYNFDDIEDPPGRWLEQTKTSLTKILNDPLFKIFKDKTLLSIVFVNDPAIKMLNQQYRGKNTTTDVLTFPLNEKLENEFLWGEIVISLDKAKADAMVYDISLFQEIVQLLVHGITHLLGYDHHSDQQELEMKSIENHLINQISFSEGVEVHE
jgi:probable rRNA maturation factor